MRLGKEMTSEAAAAGVLLLKDEVLKEWRSTANAPASRQKLTLRHTCHTPDVSLADLHKPPATAHRCQRRCYHAAAGQRVQHHMRTALDRKAIR